MTRSPAPLNLPCRLAATTAPVTGAPARMTLTAWTTRDCDSVPVKLSLTLLPLAVIVCPTRTTTWLPAGTTYFLGGGGGGGTAGAGGGGGGGASLCAGAGAGAGAAAGAASGAGAGVGGGAAWAVVEGSAAGAAGAGVLLHPPRSSNPVSPMDSMPPREYAICLCLWPLVECPGLKNACFFMIVSLD